MPVKCWPPWYYSKTSGSVYLKTKLHIQLLECLCSCNLVVTDAPLSAVNHPYIVDHLPKTPLLATSAATSCCKSRTVGCHRCPELRCLCGGAEMLIQPRRSSCCSSDWGLWDVASHWRGIHEFRRYGCCPSANLTDCLLIQIASTMYPSRGVLPSVVCLSVIVKPR